MKPKQRQDFLKDLKDRGYVEHNGTLYPPNQAEALGILPARKTRSKVTGPKTGWIDDYRNLRNKEAQKDMFIRMIEQELDVEVWPEFFFSTEREFRLDYAIPVLKDGSIVKVAVEQEGGVWMKGGGAHSRPANIMRDMEKSTMLNLEGWTLIRRTPDQMLTNETLEMVRKAIQKKFDYV